MKSFSELPLSASLKANLSKNGRSEEHTSELQSQSNLVCRLLLEKKNIIGTVRGVDLDHHLGFHPRLVRRMCSVKPIIDENEFALGLGFISLAELCRCSGRLESRHLASLTIESITGAQITVKFEAPGLVLQVLDLGFR